MFGSFHRVGVAIRPLLHNNNSRSQIIEEHLTQDSARRHAMAIISAQLSFPIPLLTAQAAVLETSQTVFKAGQALSIADAEARLKEGRKSAQSLLDHYNEICEGGGDNVRRYLGTVGTTSGLFGDEERNSFFATSLRVHAYKIQN